MRRENQRLEIEPAREGSADALRRLSRSPGRLRRSTILVYLDVEVHAPVTWNGPSKLPDGFALANDNIHMSSILQETINLKILFRIA